MANDRVYFIPWDQTTGSVLSSRCDVYNNYYKDQTHHKRNWTPVFYDDVHPGGVIANMGSGWGTRLVVAGHGAVNDGNIYATEAGANPLSYTNIVDRLVAHGLKKYYTGTIGCDVCHSAEGANPFAKRLAKELHNRGYKLTCVIGYKGSLYSGYDLAADSTLDGDHKYRHRTVETASGDRVKSKNAQERFYGL
ncbi:hypothetical protein [Acidicapsa acidisoli]|uniref:hypothetical protein n=1 Tax=Acidicapsa acidisoli TaxID=1615681 RepID=UPI0021E08104|nr:hypothetical protein [Acidicapsa acidisoli]